MPTAGAAGWILRTDNAVCFVSGSDAAPAATVFECCSGAPSGPAVLGRLVAALSRAPAPPWPDFAVVTCSPVPVANPSPTSSCDGDANEVVVLVHGRVPVTLEGDGEPESAGAAGPAGGGATWWARAVPSLRRVALGDAAAMAAGPGAGWPAAPAAGGMADLRSGVLPASGAVLTARPAPVDLEPPAPAYQRGLLDQARVCDQSPAHDRPAPVTSVVPEAETASPAPAELSVAGLDVDDLLVGDLLSPAPGGALGWAGTPPGALDATVVEPAEVLEPAGHGGELAPTRLGGAGPAPEGAGVEGPGPAPLVRGRYCSRSHFNAPRDRWCRVCGVALAQDPQGEVEGRRPPLGQVVWDSGETDLIRRDTVVGREPGGDHGVASGAAEGLVPRARSEGMSRVHAELRLIGWEILLSDRASTNGTFVWDEVRQEWHRLDPGERYPLHTGSIVAFGELTATFEAATT